jgi:hypothetical protein
MLPKRRLELFLLVIFVFLAFSHQGFAMLRSADTQPEGQPQQKRRRLEEPTNGSKIPKYPDHMSTANYHYIWGTMHEEGKDGKKNEKEAYRQYKFAAAQGHADAQWRLGSMYAEGRGVEQDEKEACRYFQLAADQGHADAQWRLRKMHAMGSGVEQDEKEAHRYFQLAANQGDAKAQYFLGVMYEIGRGVEKDEKEACRYFQLAANQGHATAQDCLRKMCAQSKAVGEGEKEAYKYFQLAANQGYAVAQWCLGNMYAEGSGVEKDEKEAHRYLQLAANQGHAAAQWCLGNMYAEGSGVEKDEKEAHRYFQLAANQGHATAQDCLRKMCAQSKAVGEGEDAIRKIESAYRKYKIAPEKSQQELQALKNFADTKDLNHPLAQYYLGLIHKNGTGVKKDLKAASDFFYHSASQGKIEARKELEGHPDYFWARHYLGDLYYKGKGVIKNKEKAIDYYRKAWKNDTEGSNKYYQDLNLYEEIREAECECLNRRSEPLESSLGRIALFRGIHYVTNLFDSEAIQKNVETKDDDNTFLVSSAACTLTDKKFLAGVPGEEELKAGKLVHKVLKKFKSETENLYNIFHETYTNDHAEFHDLLETPENAKTEEITNAFSRYRWVFQNLAQPIYPQTWKKAVLRNPFVSFACHVKHGLKYAAGQKSFEGGEKSKLLPHYDNAGEPENQHLGKLYVAVLSPADLWKLNPTFVVDKHAQNKLEVSTHHGNNILSENEVSFFGYLPKGLVKFSKIIEAPSFVKHSKLFAKLSSDEQFGIPVAKYEDWRIEIVNDRNAKKVEKGIVSHLVESYLTELLEEKATDFVHTEGYLRIYPDIFEGFYASLSSESEKIKVSKWLRLINAKTSMIVSSPLPGEGGATKDSLSCLAANLTRQPLGLHTNWMETLRKINISFCNLADSGSSLVQILKNEKVRLQKLSLKKCQLTRKDTEMVAESLKNNKHLKTLILDGNAVDDDGAKIFAKSLKENSALRKLSLYHTSISNVKCFAELFPKGGKKNSLNTTLLVLNLDLKLKLEHLKKIQKGLGRNLKQ